MAFGGVAHWRESVNKVTHFKYGNKHTPMFSLANLRHLVNLKRLYIGLNRIQEISEISKLSPLQSLQEISMIGNGVARRMLHRNQW